MSIQVDSNLSNSKVLNHPKPIIARCTVYNLILTVDKFGVQL